MTENALDKRREYQRKYYKEHQKEITTRQNNWRKENKDKVRQYAKTYWENVAKKQEQLSN